MRLLSLLFTVVVSVVAFAQAPTITSFTPAQAAVGASVTISGSNFSGTIANNIVRFGSVTATVTAATTTQLTVTVPKGAVYAPISVVVSNKIGSSSRPFHITNTSTASSIGNNAANWGDAISFTSGGYSAEAMDMIIAAGDFDGNGWSDVVKIGSGALHVHRNLISTAGTTISTSSFSAATTLTTDGTANCVITGDVNADGKLDIISSSGSGINIFINNSSVGSFTFAAKYLIPSSGSNIVRVADLDMDGLLDFVGFSGSNINVWKNTTSLVSSTWTFSVGAVTTINVDAATAGTDNIESFDVGDMNLDGEVDIVATTTNTTGCIKYIANTNSTAGTMNLTYSNSDIAVGGGLNLGIADIDADGDLDIMTRAWKLFRNDNSAAITSSAFSSSFSTINLSLYEFLYGISFADFRGVGRLDMTGGTTWDKVWTHFNAGNPLSASSFPGFSGALNNQMYQIGSANTYSSVRGPALGVDLNGDDKIDFLCSRSSSAAFSVVENKMGAKVNVTQAISTFNKCINSASSQQSFTVSGSELQGNIVITPPTGFEISTTSGSGFATTAITLTPTSGTVNSTLIYVRVPASNNTSSSGTLTIASTGTSTVNVSLASTMLPDLVVTGNPSTNSESYCLSGTATALTAAATGQSVTYQWQSSTTSNGSYTSVVGGTGATTASYTPPTTSAGTLYYRCYFNSACGNTASAASGAITVNANNTAGTASANPTLCINSALTDITRTTTGATGIGTATGLPAGVTAAWASNTITVSGTPTASGTFNYSIPLSGGCGSVNATGTITVSPASTVGAASYSPNVCPNVAMTSITHTTTGATGIGTATGLPTGLSAAWASNTITISGTPTQSGTFNYSIPLTGCGSVNATGTIIIKGNNLSITSQPSTTNQVYCLNATATTLSVNVTDGATYQWIVMDAANWSGSSNIAGATSTTYTPPTNVAGTKYYRCYVWSCSGSNTSSQSSGAITTTDGSVWTGTVSTDPSNAANWNATCGSGNKVVIAGTPFSPEYTNLTIASGETFDIQEGAKVTVNGILSNSGTLNIKNNATLVQGASSTYVGTGTETVNVQQKITGGSSASAPSGRFWYLGSPVVNANATAFYSTSSSNVVKERDEPNNQWNVVTNSSSVALTPGKGYYVRASNGTTSSSNATSLSLTFTGNGLNNGAVTTPNLTSTGASFTGFNLVSNPYPSYTDWTTVTKTNVGGTMWYRTHDGTNMNFGTVNASGVGTTVGSTVLTKYIPPMQSFWVRVSNYGQNASLTFNNSDRSHFVSTGGSVAGLKSTNSGYDLFIRMNLLQGEKTDQIIVYTDDIASNSLDVNDAEKMMQADYPQFYTKVGNQKTVINALNPAKKQQSLPLIMELPSTGVHSFVIDQLEIEAGMVWLEDKQEEIIQTLEPGTVYEFFANSGMNTDRFVLHFNILDNSTPAAPNYGEVNSSANFSGKGANVHAEAAGVVVIKLPASTEGVTDIQIRDAAGRLVYTGSTNTLETSVQLSQANGIYYVTLNSNAGVEVRKVFIQQ